MSSDASEHEEEVHFANYAQACVPFPVFDRVESLVGPFARKVVQSAKPDQSRADYLGLSAQRLSNKKRTQNTEVEFFCEDFELDKERSALPMLFPSRERIRLDSGARESVIPDYPRYEDSGCKLIVTATGFGAHVSEHSDDDGPPELIGTSEEDEDDRPGALPTPGPIVNQAASPVNKIRTRRMAHMDSFNYPDAILCSDGDADGGVDVAQPPRLEYEHDVGLVPAPQTSSKTARKTRTSGKKKSTATTVSKRSQRSGVMNRRSASCDESPSRRRRPSFDTTSSARRSSLDEDDQRADGAGAAPTYSGHPGDM
jgi:hypothetical protein